MRDKEFLTSREVQRVLRCKPCTVRRYLVLKQISATKVNQRRFLYHTDSIERFINSRMDPRHGT